MEEIVETLASVLTLSFILTMYLPSITFAPRGTRTGAGPERAAGAAKAKGRSAIRVEECILNFFKIKCMGEELVVGKFRRIERMLIGVN